MLQKSKSKQVKLLKYALLIPVVLGMLMYSSCEKQSEVNETDSLGLDQYSYTVKKGEKELSVENKAIHDKYEDFLKENSEYVSWEIYDKETETVSYSVHSQNEKILEGFETKAWDYNFPDGKSYKMFRYFKRIPETEESKKEKAEKLLKQKEAYKNAAEVPFSLIDQVPISPGCENLSNEERKKCISKKILEYVGKNFNTKIGKKNKLVGKQRINVLFKIDEKGYIIDVISRAPNPVLEAEAIRVVKSLPKFKPGINNGKAVTVPYSLPIVFQVQ